MKTLALVLVLLCSVTLAYGEDWTAINYPGATDTYPRSVDGNNVVGFYMTTASYPYDRGFLYNLATKVWTPLDKPGVLDTTLTGISGDKIVGTYQTASHNTYGLVYDMKTATWSTYVLRDGGVAKTAWPCGIEGDSVVGVYENGDYAFTSSITDGNVYSTVQKTGTTKINPRDISGDQIVGDYRDSLGRQHAFIYDKKLEDFSDLDSPDAALYSTNLFGIDGDNVVGNYTDILGKTHGLLHNTKSKKWTPIADPNGADTTAFGISGDMIVGTFADPEGFVYTIPEPATLALLTFSGALLLRRKK